VDVPLDSRPHSESLTLPVLDERSRVTAVHTPPHNPSVTAVLPPQSPASFPALPAFPASAPKGASSRAAAVVVGVVLALLVLAAGGWAARKPILARWKPPAAPSAIASEAPVASSAATGASDPAASQSLPSTTEPEPAASALAIGTASASASAKPLAKRPPVGHTRRPAVDECDPPYLIDDQGVKRFKKRCL
jgi:serine/threonine-protein kinase